ncbi:Methyltransferase-like protein 7B [Lachnellula suecica]|uniref:Methyltransferase-like protein 7B n=1 Tax=Lachnellula suecica TaxID=602035 RepID=A0A8T9BU89_9HELO|nr:Methyltransferase-like protein 7B [Lachnellula suecica]
MARLPNIIRPLQLIWLSVKFHYAAFKADFSKNGLSSIAHPQRIRDAAVANLLTTIAPGFIAYEDTTIVPSLARTCHGKILELGPGPGNNIHRYDASLVDFIYAIDPNDNYGAAIAATAKRFDLQDKYKFIACGVEDSDVLRKEGVEERSMDTVLSLQVLCAVRDVKSVMREVYKLLKPGGSFVFWEHEKSRDTLTAVTQSCLNPAWSGFVGCNMNRNIMADILAAGEWQNPGEIEVGDDPHSVLPRIWGVLKKKA